MDQLQAGSLMSGNLALVAYIKAFVISYQNAENDHG